MVNVVKALSRKACSIAYRIFEVVSLLLFSVIRAFFEVKKLSYEIP